ncbi:MAG: hypothetical protein AB1489_13125 [Acidobacteriota bacterium]
MNTDKENLSSSVDKDFDFNVEEVEAVIAPAVGIDEIGEIEEEPPDSSDPPDPGAIETRTFTSITLPLPKGKKFYCC